MLEPTVEVIIGFALGNVLRVLGLAALALAIEATCDLNPSIGGFWLRFVPAAVLLFYAYWAAQSGCLVGMVATGLTATLVLLSMFTRPLRASASASGRWSWNVWLIVGVSLSWVALRPCFA